MGNQLKSIAKKGFAVHGYPDGTTPKTLMEVEEKSDTIGDLVDNKVDKEAGKQLTTNDYTDQDKDSLLSITEKIKELDLSDILNTNSIPEWSVPLSDLFRTDQADFNNMKYDCCLVSSSVMDFPEALKEGDISAYVITHRNGENGVQILIGSNSGQIISRRKNAGKLTAWSSTASLIDSYTSDLTNVAPTAAALHQAYLSLTDKILELDLIVTGGDISVFPHEAIIPSEGGSIEIIIKTSESWIIKPN